MLGTVNRDSSGRNDGIKSALPLRVIQMIDTSEGGAAANTATESTGMG